MSVTIDIPRNTRGTGPHAHRPSNIEPTDWKRPERGSRFRRQLTADTISLTRPANHRTRPTPVTPVRVLPRPNNTRHTAPLVIPPEVEAGLKNARHSLKTTRPEHIAIMMIDGEFDHFSSDLWQRAFQSMDLTQPNPIPDAVYRLHLAEYPQYPSESLLGLAWLRAAQDRDKNLQEALITTVRDALYNTWTNTAPHEPNELDIPEFPPMDPPPGNYFQNALLAPQLLYYPEHSRQAQQRSQQEQLGIALGQIPFNPDIPPPKAYRQLIQAWTKPHMPEPLREGIIIGLSQQTHPNRWTRSVLSTLLSRPPQWLNTRTTQVSTAIAEALPNNLNNLQWFKFVRQIDDALGQFPHSWEQGHFRETVLSAAAKAPQLAHAHPAFFKLFEKMTATPTGNISVFSDIALSLPANPSFYQLPPAGQRWINTLLSLPGISVTRLFTEKAAEHLNPDTCPPWVWSLLQERANDLSGTGGIEVARGLGLNRHPGLWKHPKIHTLLKPIVTHPYRAEEALNELAEGTRNHENPPELAGQILEQIARHAPGLLSEDISP